MVPTIPANVELINYVDIIQTSDNLISTSGLLASASRAAAGAGRAQATAQQQGSRHMLAAGAEGSAAAAGEGSAQSGRPRLSNYFCACNKCENINKKI